MYIQTPCKMFIGNLITFDFILLDFCAITMVINNVENARLNVQTKLRRVELLEMINLFSDKRNRGIDRSH